MEKTLKFSVLKEKIIKTNELLHLHLEKTREVDKLQKCYQQLKTKLEFCKEENKKLTLKNEALSYNLQLNEKELEPLREEHKKLKLQEDESGKTINELQISYQLASQELSECKIKLSKLEEQQTEPEIETKKEKRKSPVKRGRKRKNEAETDDSVVAKKIVELAKEKEKLVSENANFKLEIYNLKKEIQNLKFLQNDGNQLKELESELAAKEQEIINLKIKLKSIEESKKSELNKLVRDLENIKTTNNYLEKENKKLKNENSSYQIQVSMLQTNVEDLTDKAEPEDLIPLCDLRDDIKNSTDKEIESIFNEMIVPQILTPLADLTNDENVDDENSTLTQQTSSSGDFMVSSFSNMTRIASRKRKYKSRKRIVKRKSKKIDLLGALIALKEANINFTVSSGPCVQFERLDSYSAISKKPRKMISDEKCLQTFSSKLECSLACCKNSYMLLKGSNLDSAPLLGFFDVKNENKQKEFQISCPSHRKRKYDGSKKKNKKALYEEQETENEVAITPLEANPVICETVPEVERRKTRSCSNSGNLENQKSKSCSGLVNVNQQFNRKLYQTRNALKKSGNKPIFNKQTVCDEDGVSLPVKKRIAHTPNKLTENTNGQKVALPPLQTSITETVTELNISNESTNDLDVDEIVTLNPKASFKRPVCRTRRSSRLVTAPTVSETQDVSERFEQVRESTPLRCPESPTPENRSSDNKTPKIIPLEPVDETVEKMPSTKIEVLFTKLINYSMEEEVLNEVVEEFSKQDPEYIAQAVLEKISKDFHDQADSKYSPAPLMTETQRCMLGFMSKLEKSNVIGVFDTYLTLAEHRLLMRQDLHEIAPITRLYLAVCKLHHNLYRMRKLCCDMFYFCGDLAVPFFFFVLTSWSEVLPHADKSEDMPLARVLVQIVYMKQCNKPGYNLMPLRDLLIKFYGYPTERWDSSELFLHLFHEYLRNPVRSSDFALLLFCKNHPEKWVHEKIEEHLKPIVDQIPAENFKAAVIILIGNLYNRFSSKSEVNYLIGVRQWLTSLVNETTPDVVKRSVYLSLNRLKKK